MKQLFILGVVVGIMCGMSAMGYYEEPSIDWALVQGILSVEGNREIVKECIVDRTYGDHNGMYNWYSDDNDPLLGEGMGFGWVCKNGWTVILFAYEGSNGQMDYVNSSRVLDHKT